MTPLERHKSRILATIKANETRKEQHTPKPPKRVWKHSYARKRFRFDTPNIGEVMGVGYVLEV